MRYWEWKGKFNVIVWSTRQLSIEVKNLNSAFQSPHNKTVYILWNSFHKPYLNPNQPPRHHLASEILLTCIERNLLVHQSQKVLGQVAVVLHCSCMLAVKEWWGTCTPVDKGGMSVLWHSWSKHCNLWIGSQPEN